MYKCTLCKFIMWWCSGPPSCDGAVCLHHVTVQCAPTLCCPVLQVGSFQPGNCSVSWVFTLALLGVLDSVILATLAFVLASRQDALLPAETRDQNLLTNP